MMFKCVVLAVIAVASAWKKPAFCNNIDCPQFRVLSKTSVYEIREYVESNWIGTSVNGTDATSAISKSFMHMFEYIEGRNARDEKIAMTAPVLTTIEPGQGPGCTSRFNTSFFIAPVVSEPPRPRDPALQLVTFPAGRVAVLAFGGYVSDDKIIEHAQQLADALAADGVAFATTKFAVAGYDAPFKVFNRHNEVWQFLE